jgi:hypothetical protein
MVAPANLPKCAQSFIIYEKFNQPIKEILV